MTGRTPIDEVLRFLGGEHAERLRLMRREGLFVQDELTPGEAEDLRVALVLMSDLGVNAAGVAVILRMRRRMIALQRRTSEVLELVLEERGRG